MVKRAAKASGSFPVIRRLGFEITFPDLITALNLCAGVGAIFSAIGGQPLVAAALIGAGMLFDYFDGKIARAYRLAHDFGRELDSLADMVTFGLAPGVLLLTAFPAELHYWAAALYAVAAAFRLARFNLLKASETSGNRYAGLPVPAAAFLLVAALLLVPLWPFLAALLPALALLLALLMLSTISFPKP